MFGIIQGLVFHGVQNMKNTLVCTSVKGVDTSITNVMMKELEVSTLFHLSSESFSSFDSLLFRFHMSMQQAIFGEVIISFILL